MNAGRAELAFVEDGVRIAAGEGVEGSSWTDGLHTVTSSRTPTIRSTVAYACSDFAGGAGYRPQTE